MKTTTEWSTPPELAFHFARQLGRRRFLRWLQSLGRANGSHWFTATGEESLAEMLGRIDRLAPGGEAWIAVADTSAYGFRVLRVFPAHVEDEEIPNMNFPKPTGGRR